MQKICWAKSAGQRALMTASTCAAGSRIVTTTLPEPRVRVVEPNLLLEVDHIMPVSRGGPSARELETPAGVAPHGAKMRLILQPSAPSTSGGEPHRGACGGVPIRIHVNKPKPWATHRRQLADGPGCRSRSWARRVRRKGPRVPAQLKQASLRALRSEVRSRIRARTSRGTGSGEFPAVVGP